DRAAASAVSKPTLITVPNLAPIRTEGPSPNSSELSERFADVWELADTGAPPESIARETGHPIGQVELILALRRQLATKPGGRPGDVPPRTAGPGLLRADPFGGSQRFVGGWHRYRGERPSAPHARPEAHGARLNRDWSRTPDLPFRRRGQQLRRAT